MDFAKGEILFQCLRLIGSGVELGRLLIAAEIQGLVQVPPPAISGPQALGRRRRGATARRWAHQQVRPEAKRRATDAGALAAAQSH